jgi:hypothetical protein
VGLTASSAGGRRSPGEDFWADIIVIDDPLKPEEALSQTQQQAAKGGGAAL